MSDPLATAAVHSLGKIADFSIAGSCIVLVILTLAYVARYFMNEFKNCHESTKKGLDATTEALNGVKLVLAKIETRLER